MRAGTWVKCGSVTVFAVAVQAADSFPERKVMQADRYTIEYSVGDEAYASALVRHLPDGLTTQTVPAAVPLSVADLRSRRVEILRMIADRLALPAPTAKMGETYDAFAAGHLALQNLKVMDSATHFALWRKPELMARLNAGQQLPGFTRAPDGGIQFSMQTSFDFKDGENPDKSIARLREDLGRFSWPIKIGEPEGGSPDDEVQKRLDEIANAAAQMTAFQSAESQRKGVTNVLHETVEMTLVSSYLRSADRRWFCEGVANYVAYRVLEQLLGKETARGYYDPDAEAQRYLASKNRVDLLRWPVAEDARAKDIPAEVNDASYALATKAVFDAFGDGDLLARVLVELRKTPLDKANIDTVYAAYLLKTGKDLRHFIQ
jgi:hypothetical protein